ncbi:MAG: undecaprenyl-phosphate glucose phosphotransferase [Acetobacterales bacterium]
MYHVRPSYLRPEGAVPADSESREPQVSAKVATGLLLLQDLVALPAMAALAFALKLSNDPFASPSLYATVAALGTLLALNVFHFAGIYSTGTIHKPLATMRRMALCWLGVAVALVALGFLTKMSQEFSRTWSLMWFGLGLASLLAIRAVFYWRAANWIAQGRLSTNVAVVGTGPLAERLAIQLYSQRNAGIRVVGIFADNSLHEGPQGLSGNRDGALEELIAWARRDRLDTVIVAIPTEEETRLQHVFRRLREIPVNVRLCPGAIALQLVNHDVSHYGGVPTINIAEQPLADWRKAMKDIEDRILGAAILTLISPLMIGIAVAIKATSRGPVLFRQPRHGYNNEIIEVLKFRTMYVDQEDRDGNVSTQRHDPRITPVGRLLRSTSLDELPQFINVLRGEMSIVGPRPHALSSKAGGYAFHEAVSQYDARHRMKPGITGWAQVNGWRGPTDTVRQLRERVEHDLYYVDNWSLWLDIKIIVMTIFKGFRSKNAF